MGILKINVDGVSKCNSGLVGVGCVIRDCQGHWILREARNLGICSPLLVKIWASFMGLQLAWERGYTNIILETDFKSVVSLLSDNDSSINTNHVLLEKCKELLTKGWTVEVSHIFKEANTTANGIANWALLQPIGRHLLTSPVRILNLLLADQQGVSYPRWVNNL